MGDTIYRYYLSKVLTLSVNTLRLFLILNHNATKVGIYKWNLQMLKQVYAWIKADATE